MPSSHLILCCPLFLLPPIPPSIRAFSNESTLHMRWPKYWRFSFKIILSKEHPGPISFRMDWLDLLAVQGTSRVFSNTTVQKHQFFGAQLYSQSNSHIHTWPFAQVLLNLKLQFSSVQFSCSVVSDYLRPHESQHARPPCPSPTPGVHSDSRPSSQ